LFAPAMPFELLQRGFMFLVIGALWTPGYFSNRFPGLIFADLSELRTAAQ